MDVNFRRLGVLSLAVLLAVSLLTAIAGCGAPSVDDIWQKSMDAEENVNSKHVDVNIYYEDTSIGSGLVETAFIDVSGENGHVQRILLNLEFSEYYLVGGKQYSRLGGSDTWTEGPPTQSVQTAAQEIGGLSELPSLSTSQENVGVEKVNGVEAYHLVFNVPPQNVGSAFPNYPASELSANTGATVDVWIDKDNYYKVKYEALISNVLIMEKVGYGNKRIVTNITKINEPINITAPI